MKLADLLLISRISLLPTVWTNTLTGVALAGGSWDDPQLPFLLVSFSLFYIGGMWLNDAFDHKTDSESRPDRPIPSGAIAVSTAFAGGFSMLTIGWIILTATGLNIAANPSWLPSIYGLVLAATIIVYDAWHKQNPLGPALMSICRMLVYFTSAVSIAGRLSFALIHAALALQAYIIGLTVAAKAGNQTRNWHDSLLFFLFVPVVYGFGLAYRAPLTALPLAVFVVWMVLALRSLLQQRNGRPSHAIAHLLAGISLLDALILAALGHVLFFGAAIIAFLLTLWLQRWISGD